jgi:FtsP/CotA-like multicopper oxidase with cupredoxin domain
MHMHGHNMYILAVGQGTWDGTVTNPQNPQRRDVQLLPVAASPTQPGYIVVQIDATNPGVWPFHCHSKCIDGRKYNSCRIIDT